MAAPQRGQVVVVDQKSFVITDVMPIWSKGSSGGGRVAEVKVEGYCLGLKRLPEAHICECDDCSLR